MELDGFFGRRAELSGLAGALDTSRLVTVTGRPGGIGKSRLSARAAPARELLADRLTFAPRIPRSAGLGPVDRAPRPGRGDTDDLAQAAVLQGAAASLWPSVGLPLFGSASCNAPHELCGATARDRLGDERYQECVRQRARHREAAVSRTLGRVRPLEGPPSPRGSVRHAEVTVDMPQPAASPTRKGGETAG